MYYVVYPVQNKFNIAFDICGGSFRLTLGKHKYCELWLTCNYTLGFRYVLHKAGQERRQKE